MTYDPLKHHRRSIRLKGYDYAKPGAYFITLCVQDRVCAIGEIVDGTMRLNAVGVMVQTEWQKLPQRFPGVTLDAFTFMPNHMHGIIMLGVNGPAGKGEASAEGMLEVPAVSSADASPLRGVGKPSGSLPAIIQNFKSISSRRLNTVRSTPGVPVWQRNDYEHIVRDEADLARIRAYVQNNPAQWSLDQLHPAAPRNRFNQDQP